MVIHIYFYSIVSSKSHASSRVVRVGIPRNVNLPHEHQAADGHGHGDDGEVLAGKVVALDVDVLARENVPPQQARQGGAEGGAEGAVVDAQGHAVHGAPEGAVGDDGALVRVDHLPRLDDPGQQDGRADVGARELYITKQLAIT